jgi:hypothetical protein
VNRVPQDGVVEKVSYVPGGHVVAWKHTAAGNESNWVHFRNGPHRFVVRQAAGSEVLVRAGDKVRGGSTVVAVLSDTRNGVHS